MTAVVVSIKLHLWFQHNYCVTVRYNDKFRLEARHCGLAMQV